MEKQGLQKEKESYELKEVLFEALEDSSSSLDTNYQRIRERIDNSLEIHKTMKGYHKKGLTLSEKTEKEILKLFSGKTSQPVLDTSFESNKSTVSSGLTESVERSESLTSLRDEEIVTDTRQHKSYLERFVTVHFGKNNEKTLVYDRNNHTYTYITPSLPVKNLVLSGGGAKGIYYGGVFQALEERKMLKHIDNISGSSIGALVAGLVAVGMPSEELLKITNFEQYFPEKMHNNGEKVIDLIRTEARKYVKENIIKLLATKLKRKIKFEDIELRHIGSLAKQLDVEDRDLIGKLWVLVRKLQSEQRIGQITFDDLRTLHAVFPEVFKELTVTAVCRESEKDVPFYFDADHTPDLDIGLACRASSSLPIKFDPTPIDKSLLPGYKSYFSNSENNHPTFIDGGYFDNVPLQPMHNKQDIPAERGEEDQNLQTLIVVFDQATRVNDPQSLFLEEKIPTGRNLSNMGAIARQIFENKMMIKHLGIKAQKTFPESVDAKLEDIRRRYAQRAIILTPTIGTTDFSEADERAEELQEVGYQGTNEYLDFHNKERVAHKVKSQEQLLALIPVTDKEEKEQMMNALAEMDYRQLSLN